MEAHSRVHDRMQKQSRSQKHLIHELFGSKRRITSVFSSPECFPKIDLIRRGRHNIDASPVNIYRRITSNCNKRAHQFTPDFRLKFAPVCCSTPTQMSPHQIKLRHDFTLTPIGSVCTKSKIFLFLITIFGISTSNQQ